MNRLRLLARGAPSRPMMVFVPMTPRRLTWRGLSSYSEKSPPVQPSIPPHNAQGDILPTAVAGAASEGKSISEKIGRAVTTAGFKFSDGSEYLGDVADNLRHGKGKMEFASGVVCDGDWVDDVFDGIGDIHIPAPHQSFYTGGIQNFKKHGYGEFYASKYSYKGNWVEGEMDGYGELSFPNEGYVGHFKAGLKHGEGTYTYANKDTYTGMFAEDKRHGYGVQRNADGGTYEGGWKDDMQHGKGKMYADGTKYIGEWASDKQNGLGMLIYSDGGTYEGDFVEGKMHGKGIKRFANGKVQDGYFEAGKFVGSAEPKNKTRDAGKRSTRTGAHDRSVRENSAREPSNRSPDRTEEGARRPPRGDSVESKGQRR
eukprot:gene16036-18313_t